MLGFGSRRHASADTCRLKRGMLAKRQASSLHSLCTSVTIVHRQYLTQQQHRTRPPPQQSGWYTSTGCKHATMQVLQPLLLRCAQLWVYATSKGLPHTVSAEERCLFGGGPHHLLGATPRTGAGLEASPQDTFGRMGVRQRRGPEGSRGGEPVVTTRPASKQAPSGMPNSQCCTSMHNQVATAAVHAAHARHITAQGRALPAATPDGVRFQPRQVEQSHINRAGA